MSKQSITDNSFPDFIPPTIKEIRRNACKYAKFYTDEEIEEIIYLFEDRQTIMNNLWKLFTSTKIEEETNNILGKVTFSSRQLNKIFFNILKVLPTTKYISNYLKYQIVYSKYVRDVYANGYLEHENIKYGSIEHYERYGKTIIKGE
ncbi:MAG: hypothetical protein NTW78_09875 [Campylobacterales bacterium]|nr:hypothetical protein [Campylobacterales bacterium]